ncbi:SH3 domain-containing protein [Candidatus Saganbacteria bacterium]|nr:SH3 domain-containing protein [Candidatus Saganbacteria bacterium]
MKKLAGFVLFIICVSLFVIIFNASAIARIVFDYWTEDGKSNFMVKTSDNPAEYFWYADGHKSIAIVTDSSSIVIITTDRQYWKGKYYLDSVGDLIKEYNSTKLYLHPGSIGYDMYIKVINDYKYNEITLREWPVKSIKKSYISEKDIIARKRPSLNSTKIHTIPKGEIIAAYQVSKNWILVYYSKKLGWIPKISVSDNFPQGVWVPTSPLSNEVTQLQEYTSGLSIESPAIHTPTSNEGATTPEIN